MGEDLVELGQAIVVELLDGGAHESVELAAPLHEQRGVGHVLGQRVLERVGQLGKPAPLVDELERAQLAQRAVGTLPDLARHGRPGAG